MKDIPKPVLIGLAVVVLIFVALIIFVDKGSDEEAAANPEDSWIASLGATGSLSLRDLSLPADCNERAGTILTVEGSCTITVPPAEGLLRRVTFRRFRLRGIGDVSVSVELSIADLEDQDIDPIEGELHSDASDSDDDEDTNRTMTVGVPPGGVEVHLNCGGLLGSSCKVAVEAPG